jgi:hypothetical protein
VKPKRARRGIILAISDLSRALSCVDDTDFDGASNWLSGAQELIAVAIDDSQDIVEKMAIRQRKNLVSEEQAQREVDRARELTLKRLAANKKRRVIKTG